MLNGGREGLFELGQQLQQQGEYQAALHCFLSCLLGLTHVQSFTSLPNCLHQVSHMTEHARGRTSRTRRNGFTTTRPPYLLYHVLVWSITYHSMRGAFNLDMTVAMSTLTVCHVRPCATRRR